MNDLFRFLLLRPADIVSEQDKKVLQASFTKQGDSREQARRSAGQHVAGKSFIKEAEGLVFAKAAFAVAEALGGGRSSPAAKISDIVKKETGGTAAKVVADERFSAEETQLADSLVAMKLLSNSAGGDAPGLATLAQGYHAIRLAASGREPVSLPVLAVDDQMSSAPKPQRPEPPDQPAHPETPTRDTAAENRLAAIDAAIETLKTLPAAGFHKPQGTALKDSAQLQRLDSRLFALEKPRERVEAASGAAAQASPDARPWMLSAQTISALPASLHNNLAELGVDLRVQSVPLVLNALDVQKTQQLMKIEKSTVALEKLVYQVGNSYSAIASNDYVGGPKTPMPSGHGNVKPVGIGDLLLVKQHVLRYEGGDLAHVENVLKSESLSRETRRLDRTETTFLQEKETTKEEQRDTQTTDRFSLKRESSETIKTDSAFKAGISVDAKYGPFVEVKANADFATSTSTESATKQASEFSKDVVARSASKLVERVLERRTTTTIEEFEEKYSHGFDNTAGAGHISGYYQWIDKVMQAQVYNYGKRLLFDVTVPEPGTNYILAQAGAHQEAQSLVKPEPFTLRADQITEGNYAIWAQKYEVGGLEAVPPPIKTVSKAIDATVNQNPHESSKSETLAIDDGYRAKYALVIVSLFWVDSDSGVSAGPHLKLLVGSNWIDPFVEMGYYDMSGEIGSVAFAYEAYKIELLAATIEIFCERTERAYTNWQLKTHAAITQGYQAKLRNYEQALAQALAAAGTVIAGRNPLFNSRLVAGELRKQCLTMVTAQQFDGFGALELSSQGYAQPNLGRTESQMPYVRFFEQAFEWEHIVYFFYPYFWGWKQAWNKRMLLDDVDPQFADFLRAGAARVVFPVRPGFEAAVVHYLETGEIWNGGPPPDISSSLYVPIIKEIQEATGAPGSEVPVGDPWLVHLPTTLVRLRPNNDLPEWQKVADEWTPTN